MGYITPRIEGEPEDQYKIEEYDGVKYYMSKDKKTLFGIETEKEEVNITIPKDVECIGKLAFDCCNIINHIRIPGHVKQIEQEAFARCKNLETLEICDGVEELEFQSFLDTPIKYVFLPETVTKVSFDTFDWNTAVFKGRVMFRQNTYYALPEGNLWYLDAINETRESVEYMIDALQSEQNSDDKIVERYFAMYYPKQKNIIPIMEKTNCFSCIENNIKFLGFDNYPRKWNMNLMKENPEIFATPIQDALYDNFKFLLNNKNLFPKAMLKELYYGLEFEDSNREFLPKEQFIENISNIISNTKDYELFLSLAYDSKQDLIDKFTICEFNNLLKDSINRMTIESIRRILKKEHFSAIVDRDNKKFINGKYSKLIIYKDIVENNEKFSGIQYSLAKELEKINPNIIEELFLDKNRFDKFFNQLNTVKNWEDILSPKERALALRNEIVGRVLYAIIRLNIEGNETLEDRFHEGNPNINNIQSIKEDAKKIKYIRSKIKRIDIDSINYRVLTEENKEKFFEYLCDNDAFHEMCSIGSKEFKGSINTPEDIKEYAYKCLAIEKMIEVNPYSFDALRGENDVDLAYYMLALNHNYLFDKKEIDLLKENNTDLKDHIQGSFDIRFDKNKFDMIALAIYNDIGFPALSDEKVYLDTLNARIDGYFKNKSQEDVSSLFRGITLFLRKNSQYDLQERQRERTKELSENIFNTISDKYNDKDRMLYCLFNYNQLAHAINEIDTRRIVIEENMYGNSSVLNKDDYNGILGNYNQLMQIMNNNNLGLYYEPNIINKSISEGYLQILLEEYKKSPEQRDDLKGKIIKTFIQSAGYKKENIPTLDTYTTYENILKPEEEKIFENLNKIYNSPKEALEQIGIYAEEQKTFFKTKALIAQRMFEDFINSKESSNIEELNYKDFYKKNGYVIQIQTDNMNNEVLVCYNSKFSEPFSVHMKDLPQNLQEVMRKESEKIVQELGNGNEVPILLHGKIGDQGLTENTPEEIIYTTNSEYDLGLDSGIIEIPYYSGNIKDDSVDGYQKKAYLPSVRLCNFFQLDAKILRDTEEFQIYREQVQLGLKTEAEIKQELKAKQYLPITNPEQVRFQGNDKTILDHFYEETIGKTLDQGPRVEEQGSRKK